ncbi:alpha/beta fold hydrolase [Microbacterium sp. A93]|uniref:alpha/beta fold hydrolase n=1 Tax=Microbacterium sp. A93 TaxID=3450716 RepID=UPI003F429846
MSSGRVRSPCGTGPHEQRLDVTCPGALAAISPGCQRLQLIGSRHHVIVVGHSLGGFTAPLVGDELHADGLVYLAGMIPLPGESFMDWWINTGHIHESVDDDTAVSFFNDVPEALAAEARDRERDQQGGWMSSPWPADHHPDIPTRAILCTDDQFFPAPFMRRHIRERLGIEPVEIPGGHYAALSEPAAVAAVLNDFASELASAGSSPW